MEHVFFRNNLRPEEIRPDDGIERFKELVEADSKIYFSEESLTAQPCPACGHTHFDRQFTKSGFSFVECQSCQTLYAEKVPSEADLKKFFRESESFSYWFKEIWQPTKDVRSRKMIKPLYDWCMNFLCDIEDQTGLRVIDLFPKNLDLYRHWAEASPKSSYTVASPMCPIERNVRTVEGLGDQDGQYDAAFLFDSLSFLRSPKDVLGWVKKHLDPKGLCFVTTPLWSGFELSVLGKDSDTLLPPERLTLFSASGFEKMAEAEGFRLLEFSTPGQLDFEKVRAAVQASPSQYPNFIRNLCASDSKDVGWEFQRFLQEQRMSSLGRIVLEHRD